MDLPRGREREEVLGHLRRNDLDAPGIPELSARWGAQGAVEAERSVVESLGISRKVGELPRTLMSSSSRGVLEQYTGRQ